MVDTEQFDKRNFERARADCERIEREDAGRKGGLTDRERQILDMWPKFEDGEYVWFGDEAKADPIFGNDTGVVDIIEFMSFTYILKNTGNNAIAQDGFDVRVKRPVQRVLDADGVEIKVGDTVYAPRMYGENSFTVSRFTKSHYGDTLVMVEEMGSGLLLPGITHTRPDSWGQLELDADLGPLHYCVARGIDYKRGSTRSMVEAFASDIIRRAKALAGAEVE